MTNETNLKRQQWNVEIEAKKQMLDADIHARKTELEAVYPKEKEMQMCLRLSLHRRAKGK